MAKKNPIIQMPEGMLQPGEVCEPLNQETNEGYLINEGYFVTDTGRYFSTLRGRFEEKTLVMNPSGYLELAVMTDHGQKHLSAHRGVLSTFCPRPDMHNLQVDHIHGDHFDNRLSELEWVTGHENNIRASQTGMNPGRSRVIPDYAIIKTVEMAKAGYDDQEICDSMPEVKMEAETARFIRTGQAGYDKDLERLGLPKVLKKAHTFLTQADCVKMRKLYEEGYDAHQIAEIMSISWHTVRHRIQKWYGKKEQRKDKNNLKFNPITEVQQKKKEPIMELPDEFKNLNIMPVNRYTSPLHIIDPCYGVSPDGRMFSTGRGNKWKEMTLRDNGKGYTVVGLSTNHGTCQFMVHRIVMATFCPREDMYELDVDHIHGVKNDNRLSELEWVTHDENMRRAAKIGLTKHKTIQRAPDEDVLKINDLAWEGKTDNQIAVIMENKYKVDNIADIRLGQEGYGEVLEKYGRKPFKYRHGPIPAELRKEIYNSVEELKDKIGYMQAYLETGKKYELSAETIRTIYGIERKARK